MAQLKAGGKVYFNGKQVEIRKIITNHATQQTLYELDTWDIVDASFISIHNPSKEELKQKSTDFNEIAKSIESVTENQSKSSVKLPKKKKSSDK